MKIVTILFVLLVQNATAQNKNENFLSKVYFPFSYGFSLLSENNINSGNLVKTGIEYRFNKSKGLYIRYDYDNRKNEYKISQNNITNVPKGEIKFDDNIIGIGYRFGKKKLKAISLFQTGLTSFEYPTVAGTTNNFKITDVRTNTTIYKITIGAEYYIVENAAITIEADFSTVPKHSIFWGDKLNTLGISIGFTTTLF